MRAIAEFRALNPGVWDRHHVSRVEVAMKESIGVAGRTGFYDRYGVARDVMQNHLMEMLALARPPTFLFWFAETLSD